MAPASAAASGTAAPGTTPRTTSTAGTAGGTAVTGAEIVGAGHETGRVHTKEADLRQAKGSGNPIGARLRQIENLVGKQGDVRRGCHEYLRRRGLFYSSRCPAPRRPAADSAIKGLWN